MEKLQFLNLLTNLIETLPKNVFASLNNLSYLYMGGNKLKVINFDAFPVPSKLDSLFVNNNQVNVIDRRILGITTLKKIDMQNDVCATTEHPNKVFE